MGGDLTVVNAARVSFDKHKEVMDESDEKLISYLVKNNHWSPFSHPSIQLRITAPVFVRTQCFKHKIGFVENEISRRYVDDEPSFFIPDVWRGRAKSNKQGSTDEVILTRAQAGFEDFCNDAVAYYTDLIDSGVAPEQARMVLPQAMYTSWYWTGSLAAYARFYKQRTDPHAQKEIQDLAVMVGDIIQPLFPISWSYLVGQE